MISGRPRRYGDGAAPGKVRLTTATMPRTDAASRDASPAAAEPTTLVVDGLAWTCCPGQEEWLRAIPAAVWAAPEVHGLTRVKHNGARSVYRATFAGRTVFAKYFFHAGWTDWFKGLLRVRACAAEWRGGLFALRQGIAAIRPIGFAAAVRVGGRRAAVLVTEAVEPAGPLNEYWRLLQTDIDDGRRRADVAQLTDVVAQLIARAHQAGFEHMDMHAENILVQRAGGRQVRAVFVDLQSARLDWPITDAAVLRNLAQLNQWFRRHASVGDRLRFLRAYLRWRNEYEHAFTHSRALALDFRGLLRGLKGAAARHATRLWSQRDRRARRSGRYFAALRLGQGWRAQVYRCCKHPRAESPASRLTLEPVWWQTQLANPLRWFGPDGATVCKESHSAAVRRTLLAVDATTTIPVLLKRPRARNLWRRLRQLLPPSRSARGWRLGHALLNRDLPAPRPLAVLERRVGPFVRDSVLVTEWVAGAADLEAFVRAQYPQLGPRGWFRRKQTLGTLLVRRLRQLQERGFLHLDCKASNLLVVSQPRLELLWIDMDGLRQVRGAAKRHWQRALARLYVSVAELPGITRTDAVRVLRAYLARFGSAPDEWRRQWRALAALVQRKQQAREARRAWKLSHYGRE